MHTFIYTWDTIYAHLHLHTPSYLHTFTCAHLHMCTPSHMDTFTFAYPHICTPSHVHTFTYAHLHTSFSHIALNVTKLAIRKFPSGLLNFVAVADEASLANITINTVDSRQYGCFLKGSGEKAIPPQLYCVIPQGQIMPGIQTIPAAFPLCLSLHTSLHTYTFAPCCQLASSATMPYPHLTSTLN